MMSQGHDQVIGGGESWIDQAPLQTRRKGNLGGRVKSGKSISLIAGDGGIGLFSIRLRCHIFAFEGD